MTMRCSLTRNTIAISAVALSGFLVSGCASPPAVTHEQAIESADRTAAEYFQRTPENHLQIVLVHDRIFVPTPIRTTVFVDRTPLGTINQGEKMTFFVPTGQLILGWSALMESIREQYFVVSRTSKNNFRFKVVDGMMGFARED